MQSPSAHQGQAVKCFPCSLVGQPPGAAQLRAHVRRGHALRHLRVAQGQKGRMHALNNSMTCMRASNSLLTQGQQRGNRGPGESNMQWLRAACGRLFGLQLTWRCCVSHTPQLSTRASLEAPTGVCYLTGPFIHALSPRLSLQARAPAPPADLPHGLSLYALPQNHLYKSTCRPRVSPAAHSPASHLQPISLCLSPAAHSPLPLTCSPFPRLSPGARPSVRALQRPRSPASGPGRACAASGYAPLHA